jgi:hypothetical protein
MIVIYRACPFGAKKKRIIDDKYELVKKCFLSFKEAFKDVKYNLVVLIDKGNDKFNSIFKGEKIERSYYPDFNEGNMGSFHRQIDIALCREDNFFFVEDDYLFVPNSGKTIKTILDDYEETKPFFITPYDHPDYYTQSKFDYKRKVMLISGHHWQTITSTTLTFGGKYQALLNEYKTMKKYGWADENMWKDITERYKLYSPIPSFATHTEVKFLAPTLKWY